MIDLNLLKVINAYEITWGYHYLPLSTRRKLLTQLVDELIPLGNENHKAACWMLALLHPDAKEKRLWLEKSAALGNVVAILSLIDDRDESTPIDVTLNLLVRYIKLSEALPQHSRLDLHLILRMFRLIDHTELALEKLTTCTITPEELTTAYSFELEIGTYTTPKTEAEHGFIEAIKNGNLAFVKNYLAIGGNPLLYSDRRNLTSTLHLAITHDRLAILEVLIKAYQLCGLNLDFRAQESKHHSVVEHAIKERKPDHIRALLNAGADPRFALNELFFINSRVYSNPNIHYPNVENFLESRTERFSLTVLPILKDEQGSLQLESYELSHDVNPAPTSPRNLADDHTFIYTRHTLDSLSTLANAVKLKFTYEFITINGYADDDTFQLELTSEYFNFETKEGTTWLHAGFSRHLEVAVLDYLKKNALPTASVSHNTHRSNSFKMYFPRSYLPTIIHFLFEFHQNHFCAVTSAKPLNKLAMLQSAFDMPTERINKMLSSYIPNADRPMLYDVDYIRLVKPIMSENERKIYRCYAELRLVAWILSSALFAKNINLPIEVLIAITAFTHHNIDKDNINKNNLVFNHATAIQIVTPCFVRPIASNYTPRLFLPNTEVTVAPPVSNKPISEVCRKDNTFGGCVQFK